MRLEMLNLSSLNDVIKSRDSMLQQFEKLKLNSSLNDLIKTRDSVLQ